MEINCENCLDHNDSYGRYLVHFKCSSCEHQWSVVSETLTEAVNDAEKNGCPKCVVPCPIYLISHEEVDSSSCIIDALNDGIVKIAYF